MPEAHVYNEQGEKLGTVSLSEQVFGVEPNLGLLRAAILSHLNSARVGTVGVKTRGEVAGGGRKPWRQKGLGRARHGSIRSPIWKGGGVVFGPVARDYSWRLPKKMKRKALLSALSTRAEAGRIIVLQELKMEQPKTKHIYEVLKNLGVEKSCLIVTAEADRNLVLSARNIPGVSVTNARELSTYDIMSKRHLLVTEDALRRLEGELA
ncbi:MAG: 50S ribosomal protein L4 [Bacillota bacterium]|nr:50S ribosomal protein L4 [Candidatus Fermentithermobacillaceae bacterium]